MEKLNVIQPPDGISNIKNQISKLHIKDEKEVEQNRRLELEI
jgi:hypothetical protein